MVEPALTQWTVWGGVGWGGQGCGWRKDSLETGLWGEEGRRQGGSGERRQAGQPGLCSQLCPFLAPLPLCLSFPTNKIKLD